MTEPTDIRSLLTSRSRARVAPRDSSITNKPAPLEVEQEDRESAPKAASQRASEPQPQLSELSSLQTELNSLPQVGKRLAVHLEQNIRVALLKLCDRHELTPEIFIEAALALLEEKPDLVIKAVDDAKVRLAKRKRAGLLRRTIAMAQTVARQF